MKEKEENILPANTKVIVNGYNNNMYIYDNTFNSDNGDDMNYYISDKPNAEHYIDLVIFTDVKKA